MTASGLLAGAVSVLQRLKAHQEVDIYRTVVALRRCRREFITSQVRNGRNYYLLYEYYCLVRSDVVVPQVGT